jgi:hypothetical protein
MKALFDEALVRQALSHLILPGAVFEVRAVGAQFKGNHLKRTISGYFNNVSDCLTQLSRLSSAEGIYITLNPVEPALLSRRANRLDYVQSGSTTGDQHIVSRRRFFIDADPVRPSGISASDREKALAHVRAREIYSYLKDRGWPPPIVADSGNGYHLVYLIDLPAKDDGLVEKVLKALAGRFDDEEVKIDCGVANPARIIKLYGTLAAKGDVTPERPHRLSKILRIPPNLRPVEREQLQALLSELASPVTPPLVLAERDRKPDKAQIREMLGFIPKRPIYGDWIKVVAAVGDALPDPADAIEVLCEWSDEERPGEYQDKLNHRLQDVHVATLIHLAKEHGWRPDKKKIEPRPVGDVEPAFLPPPPAPYVPPPLTLLSPPLQDYVPAAAESLNVDVAYVFLPLLSALGAAIGNARSIQLKRGFVQPPVIWSGIIGRSGSRKSPAIETACFAVMQHERQLMWQNKQAKEQHENDVAEWNSKKPKERGVKPDKPALLTCVLDDLTIEVLGDTLMANPRGIIVCKDEISHWLASFDQYRSSNSKGSDVARWLTLHTAAFFGYDRRTDDRHYRILNPRVCLAGGIQPKILRRVMSEEFFERGLPARLLFAYPPERQDKWNEAIIADDLRAVVLALFDDLWLLAPEPHDTGFRPMLLHLAADAKAEYVSFYDQTGAAAFESDEHGEAAWAKLSGYAARLALVGQLARDPQSEIVTGEVMRAACELARWCGNEAVRIYAALAETRQQRERRELIEFIERRGGMVYEREVMQSFTRLKNDKPGTERELTALVTAQLGKWEPVDHGGGPGRPARKFLLLQSSTSTQFRILRGKTWNSVDVDAPSSQKNEPAQAPANPPDQQPAATPDQGKIII